MADNKIIDDFPALIAKQCFSKPPGRYSDASICSRLDKLSILRPSMSTSITKILVQRGYIKIDKGSITVSELGLNVTDFLIKSGFEFMNVDYTAELEKQLDEISNGKNSRLAVLTKFYESLKKSIDHAQEVKKQGEQTEHKCPKCSGDLLLKHSRWGAFYSCANYKKDGGCKYTANVGEHGEVVEKVPKEPPKESEIDCPACGKKLVVRTSKKGNAYLSCVNWNKNKNCAGFFDMLGKKMEFSKKKWFKKKKQ